MAKAWEDSPYLFIVKVQPLFRGVEDEDIGAEQLSFAFTSEKPFHLKSFSRSDTSVSADVRLLKKKKMSFLSES